MLLDQDTEDVDWLADDCDLVALEDDDEGELAGEDCSQATISTVNDTRSKAILNNFRFIIHPNEQTVTMFIPVVYMLKAGTHFPVAGKDLPQLYYEPAAWLTEPRDKYTYLPLVEGR